MHISGAFFSLQTFPTFSPRKNIRASPLKEVNLNVFSGVDHQKTNLKARSNRLSSWQMELGSSKWSYIDTCGWKCYDSAYDACFCCVMTVGWKTRWMVLRLVEVEVVFSFKVGYIRIRGLECFFLEECRKIPLWVDIYTELGGGNSNIF